jgi:ElaA protein
MIIWTWYKFEELATGRLYDILALRQEVFIREQRCLYPDIDYKDQNAMHLLGIEGNELIAYLRFLPKGIAYPDDASMGRISLAPRHRGTGLGKLMMKKLLDYCEQYYPNDGMLIMAQVYLQTFYESFGFYADGEAFDDEGIMHINMRRNIASLERKK